MTQPKLGGRLIVAIFLRRVLCFPGLGYAPEYNYSQTFQEHEYPKPEQDNPGDQMQLANVSFLPQIEIVDSAGS